MISKLREKAIPYSQDKVILKTNWANRGLLLRLPVAHLHTNSSVPVPCTHQLPTHAWLYYGSPVRHANLPKEKLRDEAIVPRLRSRHAKLSEERLRSVTKERLCR